MLELSGIPNNYLGSCAAINITGKVLDHQFNPEANKFIDIYAKTNKEIIKKMRLDYHILRIGSQNNPGLVCLFRYLNNNSKVVNLHELVGTLLAYG